MTIWHNSDGLDVKFGRDESNKASGGEVQVFGDRVCVELTIPYTEVVTTSPVIVGSVANPGALGVVLNKGLFIEEVSLVAETPFTSSGTIGTSTFVMGLTKTSDRSTQLSATGLTTTSLVGSVMDAQGETTRLIVGSTGAGAYIGTTLTEDVIIDAKNSQNASHPFTAGVLKVRIIGYYPGI